MTLKIDENPIYIQLSKSLHPQDFEVFKQILVRYEFDLAPTHGYFSEPDFNSITKKSLEEFFEKISQGNLQNIDGEDLRYLWQEVINNFWEKYWGFTKYQEKPTSYREPQKTNLPLTPQSKIPKRENKKVNYKDSFFYIWAALQAMFIAKTLILVFGNRLAYNDTLQNRIIFGAVIFFSFGSLFLFAWIRRKTPK
jgi:hypothetical protein